MYNLLLLWFSRRDLIELIKTYVTLYLDDLQLDNAMQDMVELKEGRCVPISLHLSKHLYYSVRIFIYLKEKKLKYLT